MNNTFELRNGPQGRVPGQSFVIYNGTSSLLVFRWQQNTKLSPDAKLALLSRGRLRYIRQHTERSVGVPRRQPSSTAEGPWTHHGRSPTEALWEYHGRITEVPWKHHGSAMEAPGNIVMKAPWKLKVLAEAPWRHRRNTRNCVHDDSVLLHRFHR